jgi:hypothetical protein
LNVDEAVVGILVSFATDRTAARVWVHNLLEFGAEDPPCPWADDPDNAERALRIITHDLVSVAKDRTMLRAARSGQSRLEEGVSELCRQFSASDNRPVLLARLLDIVYARTLKEGALNVNRLMMLHALRDVWFEGRSLYEEAARVISFVLPQSERWDVIQDWVTADAELDPREHPRVVKTAVALWSRYGSSGSIGDLMSALGTLALDPDEAVPVLPALTELHKRVSHSDRLEQSEAIVTAVNSALKGYSDPSRGRMQRVLGIAWPRMAHGMRVGLPLRVTSRHERKALCEYEAHRRHADP